MLRFQHDETNQDFNYDSRIFPWKYGFYVIVELIPNINYRENTNKIIQKLPKKATIYLLWAKRIRARKVWK